MAGATLRLREYVRRACQESAVQPQDDQQREHAFVGPTGATPRCVLTHHWLVRRRGGEKVLECFRELFPDAPLYTLVYAPSAELRRATGAAPVHTSPLQWVPGAVRHYPKLLPLMPWAYRRVRLPAADLVLCSDAALAKCMRAHPASRVVCYCHSPPRYLHDPHLSAQYRQTLPAALRPLWGPLTRALARADVAAAQRVDVFLANSRHVSERIQRWYGRSSDVLYPPVELPPDPPTTGPPMSGPPMSGPREAYYLCVGHQTPYKRLDLAVAACVRLGRPLVVIGDGPAVEQQRATAATGVRFLGWQPDEVIADHYRRARALLFPGEEDFGIVPVEALAHGCPVVAYGVGGATETVPDGIGGVLFAPQTAEALAEALLRFETLCFDPHRLYPLAERFSRRRFMADLRARLTALLAEPPQRTSRASQDRRPES